ncbi:MAG: DUF3575 domain-containing protein [Cyclobacteriaceae bacterium]|nr:DUF3575 domain-containing protein [Cyclobacteriaceae bacterium]
MLLLFIMGAFVVNAQSNAIKLNYLSLIVKSYNVQFEHAINEKSSAQLGVYFLDWSPSGLSTKFQGFALTPEYRFYLGDTPAPEGFFVAPYLRYQSYKLTDTSTSDEANYTNFGGGAIIGKQWLFSEKVTFEVFLGPAYGAGKVDVVSGSNVFNVGSFDGFVLRWGTTIGFAF